MAAGPVASDASAGRVVGPDAVAGYQVRCRAEVHDFHPSASADEPAARLELQRQDVPRKVGFRFPVPDAREALPYQGEMQVHQ